MNEIILTSLQEEAKDKIVQWFRSYKNKEEQVFVLAGYAGTGKTFLINYIIKNILKLEDEEVAYVAPTGKAANVLIQRGAISATTIHRLIYHRIEKEFETEVDGKKVKSKRIDFIKRDSLPKYKLIILDETSMVNSEIMKDLLSFGIPVLCSGDPFQLPPPSGTSNGLLEKPNIVLTEIVRQESENAIVKLATSIRNGEVIYPGNYGDVIIISKESISENIFNNLLIKADQVICGTNNTRKKTNRHIKKLLGLDPNKMNIGEKVICLLNNWSISLDDNEDYYLVNGLMGNIKSITEIKADSTIAVMKFQPDFLEEISPNIVFDTGNFKSDKSYHEFFQNVYLMKDGSYQIKKGLKKQASYDSLKEYLNQKIDAILSEQLNFFDSAYCISCHKSQGAEWNNVVVIDESRYFKEDSARWLYTAVTRAKKKLVIIQ